MDKKVSHNQQQTPSLIYVKCTDHVKYSIYIMQKVKRSFFFFYLSSIILDIRLDYVLIYCFLFVCEVCLWLFVNFIKISILSIKHNR